MAKSGQSRAPLTQKLCFWEARCQGGAGPPGLATPRSGAGGAAAFLGRGGSWETALSYSRLLGVVRVGALSGDISPSERKCCPWGVENVCPCGTQRPWSLLGFCLQVSVALGRRGMEGWVTREGRYTRTRTFLSSPAGLPLPLFTVANLDRVRRGVP